MAVWEYYDSSREVSLRQFATHCHYCRAEMDLISDSSRPNGWGANSGPDNRIHRRVLACPCCGWWYIHEQACEHIIQEWREDINGACGALKNLSLADLSTPIDEVRDFLTARYEGRFTLSPRLFEETVASVFADLGYSARVTGRSGDGGVDVVMDSSEGETIGVQVKRWRSSVEVEQIRSFAGALVLAGHTRGIYVTTSGYQSGAADTARRFAYRGLGIELYDGPRFFEALQIAQRHGHASDPDRMDFYDSCALLGLSSSQGTIEE